MKKTLFFTCIICFLGACKSTDLARDKVVKEKDNSTVNWMDAPTISPILDKAQEEGKLVFLDLYTDWCLPCQLMDEDVFTDKGTGDLLNADFISYKVNAEKRNGPDLKFLFQVSKYPTLLFLDAKGYELLRKEGAAYPSEMKNLITEAKQLMEEKRRKTSIER